MEEGDWSAPESSAWHPPESAGSRPPGLRLAAPHGQQSLIRVSRTASTAPHRAASGRNAPRCPPHVSRAAYGDAAATAARRRDGAAAPVHRRGSCFARAGAGGPALLHV
jgi:hypothetical protein